MKYLIFAILIALLISCATNKTAIYWDGKSRVGIGNGGHPSELHIVTSGYVGIGGKNCTQPNKILNIKQ